ncbi:MAG: peptide ABC transporter substrate-binding protein, partial [Limisphaerales bacterium]
IIALLEGLTYPDPKTLEPRPGAAESWKVSDDQLTYTFNIRKNARWSNGDPVTAQDFVRSYQRMLSPTLAAEYAYMLHYMENAEEFNTGKITDFSQVGAKALDDHTLQIKLRAPTPYFLSLLSHYSWFPVHMPTIEKHGAPYQRGNRWTLPENYVGNGPFVLDSWRRNQLIVVKKSPTYWDANTVRLNEIRFYPIDSDDTEERAFRSGQLHVTQTVPLTKIDVYKRDNPNLIRIDPYLGTYFYRFNVRQAPLNNVQVRRALSMAIDRKSLVENVTRGGQIPAHHFTPKDTAGYTSDAEVPFDIEGARKLLAEAGYPEGRGLPPVEILFNTLEAHRTIAEAIQQMWKKNLNVDARLVNQEWKVYLDSQKQGNFQVSRAGWIGDYPDPNTFLNMWLTGGANNQTGWSNPEYDRLIAEAGRTADQQKRYDLFRQAERILMAESPIMPIYFYTRVYLKHPSVQGWYPNILDNHPYKYVYLETQEK